MASDATIDLTADLDAFLHLDNALSAALHDPAHSPIGGSMPFAEWIASNHRSICAASAVDDATARGLVESIDIANLASLLRDPTAMEVVAAMRTSGARKLDIWLDRRLGPGGFDAFLALCAKPDWTIVRQKLGDGVEYGLARLAWIAYQTVYRHVDHDIKEHTESERLLGAIGKAVGADKRAEIAQRYLALDAAGLRRTPTTPLAQRALAIGVFGPEAFKLHVPDKGPTTLVKAHEHDDHVVQYPQPADITLNPDLDPKKDLSPEDRVKAKRAQLDDFRLRVYRRLAEVLGGQFAYDLLEAIVTVLMRKIAQRWAVQAPGADPAYKVQHTITWDELDGVGHFTERIRPPNGRMEAVYTFRRNLCLYLSTLAATALTEVAEGKARSLLILGEIAKVPPPKKTGWTKHQVAVDGLFSEASIGIGNAFWKPLFGDDSILYSIGRPSRIFNAGGLPVRQWAVRMRGQGLIDLLITRSNASDVVAARQRAMRAKVGPVPRGTPSWVVDPGERVVEISDGDLAHLVGMNFGSYAVDQSRTERNRERAQVHRIMSALRKTNDIRDYYLFLDDNDGVRLAVRLGNGMLRDHVQAIEILPPPER